MDPPAGRAAGSTLTCRGAQSFQRPAARSPWWACARCERASAWACRCSRLRRRRPTVPCAARPHGRPRRTPPAFAFTARATRSSSSPPVAERDHHFLRSTARTFTATASMCVPASSISPSPPCRRCAKGPVMPAGEALRAGLLQHRVEFARATCCSPAHGHGTDPEERNAQIARAPMLLSFRTGWQRPWHDGCSPPDLQRPGKNCHRGGGARRVETPSGCAGSNRPRPAASACDGLCERVP